jgi:hypothetical protein
MLQHCFPRVEFIGFEFKLILIQIDCLNSLGVGKEKKKKRKGKQPNPLGPALSPRPSSPPPLSSSPRAFSLPPFLSPRGPSRPTFLLTPELSARSAQLPQRRPLPSLSDYPGPRVIPLLSSPFFSGATARDLRRAPSPRARMSKGPPPPYKEQPRPPL